MLLEISVYSIKPLCVYLRAARFAMAVMAAIALAVYPVTTLRAYDEACNRLRETAV
jgi:hypothetical protein